MCRVLLLLLRWKQEGQGGVGGSVGMEADILCSLSIGCLRGVRHSATVVAAGSSSLLVLCGTCSFRELEYVPKFTYPPIQQAGDMGPLGGD